MTVISCLCCAFETEIRPGEDGYSYGGCGSVRSRMRCADAYENLQGAPAAGTEPNERVSSDPPH